MGIREGEGVYRANHGTLRRFHSYRQSTGHKGFDKQCDYITTGNHSGNGVFSGFIRARSETECNGFVKDPGVLQDFDLDVFTRNCLIIPNTAQMVRNILKDRGGCLYVFFVGRREKRRVFGCVLTDNDGKSCGHGQPAKVLLRIDEHTTKAKQVMDWCAMVVSEGVDPDKYPI